MNKFLKTCNLPRLNYDKTENRTDQLLARRLNESSIKTLPNSKSPVPDSFTGEFYKTFKEELTSNLLKLFQTIDEGTLVNSFSKASITLKPKADKDHHKKNKL